MKYRHEIKQEITYGDMVTLRQRLSVVLHKDKHALDGSYKIRSLYFDNAKDKALREKIDGVNNREKFRIRYYDDNTSLIKLEKKSKRNGLYLKESTVITKEQVEHLLEGNYQWMWDSQELLVKEFYTKIKSEGLRPKTIVDYIREPFVFSPGNVRITLDYQIKTGMNYRDFLENNCVMIPVANNPIILEIKWDEFLPDIIKSIVQIKNGRVGAFSKYAACRMYE